MIASCLRLSRGELWETTDRTQCARESTGLAASGWAKTLATSIESEMRMCRLSWSSPVSHYRSDGTDTLGPPFCRITHNWSVACVQLTNGSSKLEPINNRQHTSSSESKCFWHSICHNKNCGTIKQRVVKKESCYGGQPSWVVCDHRSLAVAQSRRSQWHRVIASDPSNSSVCQCLSITTLAVQRVCRALYPLCMQNHSCAEATTLAIEMKMWWSSWEWVLVVLSHHIYGQTAHKIVLRPTLAKINIL